MPTYRYRCEGCGDEFEVWQSITDDALTTHDGSDPDGDGCGGAVVKVLSPAGIVLKGSGFYKTDNRGKSSSRNGDGAKDSKSSDSSKSGSDASSKSGSESKSGSGSGDSSSSGSGSSSKSGASSSSSSSSSTS